jgi:hypothetical protein
MKINHKGYAILLAVLCLTATPILVFAQSGGATLSGDQTIIKGNFTLGSDHTLNGNLSVINGITLLEAGSAVNGNVSIIQGEVTASGLINGDLFCINCQGTITDSAEVRGVLLTMGQNLVVSSKAKIRQNSNISFPFNFSLRNFNIGDLIKQLPKNQTTPSLISKILMTVFVILAMSALSVLIALLFPRGTRNVAAAFTSQPLAAWGVGFLTVLVAEIAAAILLVTLILIPVSVAVQLGLVAAIVFGYVALGYEIGHRVSVNSNLNWTEPIAAGVGTLLLGLVVGICSWIPILGFVILVITPFFGLGAVVLSAFGRRIFPLEKNVPPPTDSNLNLPPTPIPPKNRQTAPPSPQTRSRKIAGK